MDNEYTVIGKPRPIGDAALKVTGQKIYVGDMELPGMLYAKVLLSTVPHARIKSIDTSAAEALPGVKAVATYKNTPQVRYNSAVRFIEHKLPDTERIFDDTVRFVGDRVAAVAAESPDIAKKAVNLIKVEYEALPVITDVEEAIKPEAWPIHEGGNIVGTSRAEAGNVDEAFQECDYVFEDRYTTQAIHHAAIEPHVAIADFAPNGKLTVYSPCQNTFAFRVIMSRIFGLSYNRIRMVAPAIGGAFGGKLEVTVEPVAAVLSQMTGKPVKVEYNRKESILSTRVRHASVNYVKTGFMKDGTLKAVDFKVYTNTGAYASSALNVSGAMSHKVFKAYKIDHMRFQCQPVYTNTEIAGAMRGYGSPQVYFGWQRQMQKIADFLHMDMADLQMKNMVDPDSCDPIFHKPHGNSRPKDCLKRALELIDYEACLKEQEATRNQDIRIGVGLALGVHGNNCVGAHRDVSTPMLKMNEDGSCIYYTGSHDMGTDTLGMQMQIVSEVLGISMDRIDCLAADTDVVHWHIGDYSSRGVFVAGSAAKKTAEAMKRELQVEAAKLLETEPDDIELHRPYIDSVTITCPECGKEMHRVPEVIDCWFDSGAMPFAQHHYPFENKDLFEQQFPADFISEAVDQTRGWFYSLLAISTLIFNKAPYKNVIVMGHVQDENGQKMSKSKGNAVDPFDALETYGADAIRWYFYVNSAPWLPNRFHGKAVMEGQRKFMGTLWNTYAFFVLYANIF